MRMRDSEDRYHRKGFTLIEIMMVVVIIGVMVTIALPQYVKIVEKGRSSEARVMLGQIRSLQNLYFLEHDAYSLTFADLQLNVPLACNPNYYFFYCLSVDNNAGTFIANATRCGMGAGGKSPGSPMAYVLNMTQDGTLGGTGWVL